VHRESLAASDIITSAKMSSILSLETKWSPNVINSHFPISDSLSLYSLLRPRDCIFLHQDYMQRERVGVFSIYCPCWFWGNCYEGCKISSPYSNS
jgi:hypothetical protein